MWARVGIKANGKWQVREIQAHNNFQGHNDLRVHFGLGQAQVIDSMRVFWPSGQVDVFTQLAVDQFLKLEEASRQQVIPEEVVDLAVKNGGKKGELQVKLPVGTQVNSLSLANEQGELIPLDFQVKGSNLFLTIKKNLEAGRYYLTIWGKEGSVLRGRLVLPA